MVNPNVYQNIQKAIADRVLSDDEMISLIEDRYDPVYVDSELFPRMDSEDEVIVKDWYTLSNLDSGFEVHYPFHIWSDINNGGPSKVQDIGHALFNLFQWQEFDVADFQLIYCKRLFSSGAMRDPVDPNVFHMVQKYAIYLQKD